MKPTIELLGELEYGPVIGERAVILQKRKDSTASAAVKVVIVFRFMNSENFCTGKA